jgi:hypothetical protein
MDCLFACSEIWMKVLGVSDGSASLSTESGTFSATASFGSGATNNPFAEIPRSSSLAAFIMSDEALYRPLLMCLTACLCWPGPYHVLVLVLVPVLVLVFVLI